MFYLAYGMNTNLAGMAHRCPQAVSICKVTVMDHKLRFRYHANAEYAPGSRMECALWNITDDCERSLDRLEGYPNYYEKKTLKVVFQNSEVDAMIYYMRDPGELSAPDQNYLNMLLQGYHQHDMDLDAIYRAYTETLNLDLIDLANRTYYV